MGRRGHRKIVETVLAGEPKTRYLRSLKAQKGKWWGAIGLEVATTCIFSELQELVSRENIGRNRQIRLLLPFCSLTKCVEIRNQFRGRIGT